MIYGMMASLGFWLCCPRKRRRSGASNCSADGDDEGGVIVDDQIGYGATESQPVELFAVDEIEGISLSSDTSLRKVYIAKDNSVRYSQKGLPKIPLILSPVPLDHMSVNSLDSRGYVHPENTTENPGDVSEIVVEPPEYVMGNVVTIESDGSTSGSVKEFVEAAELDDISEQLTEAELSQQPSKRLSQQALQTSASVRSKKSDDSGVASLEGAHGAVQKKKRKMKKPKLFKSFHMSFKRKKNKSGELGSKRRHSLFNMSTPSLARTTSMASSLSSASQRRYSAALVLGSLDDLSDDNICKE